MGKNIIKISNRIRFLLYEIKKLVLKSTTSNKTIRNIYFSYISILIASEYFPGMAKDIGKNIRIIFKI